MFGKSTLKKTAPRAQRAEATFSACLRGRRVSLHMNGLGSSPCADRLGALRAVAAESDGTNMAQG